MVTVKIFETKKPNSDVIRDIYKNILDYKKKAKDVYQDEKVFSELKNLIGFLKKKFEESTTVKRKYVFIKHFPMKYGREKTFQFENEHMGIETYKSFLSSYKKSISDHRKTIKQNKAEVTPNHIGVNVVTVGKVHDKPGTFLNLLEVVAERRMGQGKTPESPEKHIGIEFEFISATPRTELAKKFVKSSLRKCLQVKDDGSLRGEDGYNYTMEVAVMLKETEYEDKLKEFLDILKDNKTKINNSCGLHVHIDVRNRNVNKVFDNLRLAENVLYSMQSLQRRTNRFCRRLNEASESSRYKGINMDAVRKFNTIEIRLHSGSLSFEQVNNWIKLLIKIADGDISREVTHYYDLVRELSLDASLQEYMQKRISFFEDESKVEMHYEG